MNYCFSTILTLLLSAIPIRGTEPPSPPPPEPSLMHVQQLTPATEAVENGHWLTDYQQALELARTTQRQLLVYFTGSDWCIWCKRLKKEVLDTEQFKNYAKEKLVLLEVDFPRRKQIPAAQQDQNRQLLEKFAVEGFPTLFLLDSNGQKLRQLGYTPGGPQAFLSALQVPSAQ